MNNRNQSELDEKVEKLSNQLSVQSDTLKLFNKELGNKTLYCQQLKEKLKNYSYVVDNCPVSVVITDTSGNIEFVNLKFTEITGYSEQEVLGKNPSFLKSGETPDYEYENLWKTIRQGKEWTGTFHNKRKNGDYFWEHAVISGIRDQDGTVSHFIAIKEDITSIKETEESLEQERLKFIQQSKMAEIGLLSSGIMHEVGNPISSIRGLISNIKDICNESNNECNKNIDKQLDIVLSEVDRLTGITHDISEFVSPNSSQIDLVDINNTIKTTCRLLKYDKCWININLVLKLDHDLPAITGIKDQFIQLFINLLNNAADAIVDVDSPTIIVTTSHTGNSIMIAVTDNGHGIDTDVQQHIFDTFFTTKTTGTGLGLPLCNSIIKGHKGSIEIDSNINVGTEIRVLLPINGIHTD